jgi:hypothetical protein
VAETRFAFLGVGQSVLPADPSRWMILFALESTATPVAFSTIAALGSLNGIVLNTNYQKHKMTFRDYAALVNAAWFGFAGGGGNATVFSVQYIPAMTADDPLEVMADAVRKYGGQ